MKFVKTVIKQYSAHFKKSTVTYVKEKEEIKWYAHWGMLITENYKKVHSGHGHGIP